MRRKNEFTKKAAWLALAYLNARFTGLDEAYASGCSAKKRQAERQIIAEMGENGGRDYRVTGKTTYTFTCAYVYEDRQSGELRIRSHTPCNVYDTPLMGKRDAMEILGLAA